MKAVYKYLDTPIDFAQCGIQVLALENKRLYREAILSLLQNNEDELFLFSENLKLLDFTKAVHFERNALTPESGSRKLKLKIQGELEQYSNTLCTEELSAITAALQALKEKLCALCEYEFYSAFEPDAKSIVKLLDFEARLTDCDNPLQALAFSLSLLHKHLPYRLFILSDLFYYFDPEELAPFFETIQANGILLLLLENAAVPPGEWYTQSIVDRDLCSIT